MTRNADMMLGLIDQQMQLGNNAQAIEMLKQLLGQDPDMAEAHALLALCLLTAKRLHAAAHEAGIALALEPSLPLGHYAIGMVRVAQRKFIEAERSFLTLLELEPDAAGNHRAMAGLRVLMRRPDEADRALARALELAPDDPATMAALGERCLTRGDLDDAARWARRALEQQAEHPEALVLMGAVALRRGDIAGAREHALWALRIDPQDYSALHLFTSIKSRTNWFLGLWWRYNAWMGTLGQKRAIMVLLGAFVVYNVAAIAMRQAQQPGLAAVLQLLWLALVVYTWVGPGLFWRSLNKELGSVDLKPGF